MHQYEILLNIYSPLLALTDQGDLVSALAKRFYWRGDELHLDIRDDVVTASGHRIDAIDAELSLLRQMILGTNSHGNLSTFLCPGKRPKTIGQPCDGLRRDGNTLILRPAVGRDLILSMLTSMDFGIVPRTALDESRLSIVNLTETSGPYRITGRSAGGVLTLHANSGHWHIGPMTPRQIEIHEVIHDDESMPMVSFEMYERNLVDYVAVNASLNTARYQTTAAKHPDAQLRSTFDIRREIIVFTDRGRRELTHDDRFDLATFVQEGLRKRHDLELTGGRIAYQFFSAMTEGALRPEQLDSIQGLRNRSAASQLILRPKFAVTSKEDEDFYKELFGDNASRFEFEIVLDFKELVDGRMPKDRQPHFYVMNVDVAWNDSVSMLSYSLSKNQLGLSGEDDHRWFDAYVCETDRASRVEMVNKLHLDALSEPVLIPLYAEPYHSTLRKPWREPRNPISAPQGVWHIVWDA